jgi:hypothetical protein
LTIEKFSGLICGNWPAAAVVASSVGVMNWPSLFWMSA